MDEELPVNAAMAMLDRYGGLWSSDRDHVRQQLALIIDAAMDLGSDDPNAWRPAEALLERMLTGDQ